jgi:hypothetical protein
MVVCCFFYLFGARFLARFPAKEDAANDHDLFNSAVTRCCERRTRGNKLKMDFKTDETSKIQRKRS